jgi:FERM, RhoGEF and pleckstrin domain protein 2
MVHNHSIFLRDLEHRILVWENKTEENHRIGDVMLKNMVVLPTYEEYVEVHQDILKRLNEMFEGDERFQTIYKDFEQEKVRF